MKTILTGGKFNKLHEGHVWLLSKAKKLGRLIVVLAHDSHNKREYAVPAKVRKKNLETLDIADKVVIGDRKKFVKVLRRFRPACIVLGYDQRLPDDETAEWVRRHKAKIIRFRKHGNYSTRRTS